MIEALLWVLLEKMELAQFLKIKLSDIQKRNPKYSLRSLAIRTKLPAGRLSELLSGKRKLSRYYADKLKFGLSLSKEECEFLDSMIQTHSRKKIAEHELSESEVRHLSSWKYFAILNLLKIYKSPISVKKISERLGIPEVETDGCLKTMAKVGLLRWQDQKYVRSYNSLTTTWDRPDESVRRLHESFIQKGKEALEEVPIELREFSIIAMAIDPKKIKRAKMMIDQFQDRISEAMETDQATEVYAMNIQLFPLVRPGKNEES